MLKMDDFLALYPRLIKYFPDWLDRFYPYLAQFARGGYPCGNQGVFIPRNKKCWKHPLTGQTLKKPLSYQMYQVAKAKSQNSRTEKGLYFFEDRENEFKLKSRSKIKVKPPDPVEVKKLNLIGDGTQEGVPKNAQEYYDMMTKKGNKITIEEAERTVQTLRDWSQTDYSDIRAVQMGAKARPKPVQQAKDIDDFIKNSKPYNGSIYRGLVFRDEKEAIFELTKGSDTIEQKAHSSWSSSRAKGLEFAEMRGGTRQQPVLVETVNKTGAPMANLSAFKEEMEVIVPKGSKHKILSIAKEADVLIIKTIEVLK